MMKLKERKAVGGLISLIGIVMVFGIASVAYLELSSTQTNLINKSFITNQKISDKNNVRLNFTNIANNGGQYDLTIDNIGSDSVGIHSYIIDRNNLVINKGEINSSISAGDVKTVSTSSFSPQPASDIIVVVSDNGKKCVIPADVSYRLC